MSRYVELAEGDNLDIDLSEIQAVVFPVEGEEVTIEPKTEEQVIFPTTDKKLIKKATVKAVTKDIDENIKPENIVLGKTILGVQGNVAPDKPDQTKTTIPTKERQVIRADIGYELAESIVEPIPDDYVRVEGEILIDKNETTYDVSEYKSAKVSVPEKPQGEYFVKVIDYDGALLDEQWLNTGDAYTLPVAPPSHDRLVFQEWVASQEIVDGKVIVDGFDVMIGAIYKTASGLSEFDIEISKGTAPTIETDGFVVTFNMDGTKDWGDGTSDDLTEHTYYANGKYMITCNGTTINTPSTSQNIFSSKVILKSVRLSENITQLPEYAFYSMQTLETITIPNSTTSIGRSCFQYCILLKSAVLCPCPVAQAAFLQCFNLKHIVLPFGLSYLNMQLFSKCYELQEVVVPVGARFNGNSVFETCYSLQTASVPDSAKNFSSNSLFKGCRSLSRLVYNDDIRATSSNFSSSSLKSIRLGGTTISSNCLEYCYLLESVEMADTVKTIGSQVFQSDYSLRKIKFSSSIAAIDSSAFYALDYVEIYDFSSATSVPTLGGGLPVKLVDPKIIVPDDLYDEWVVATNWVSKADYIYKASEVQL
jgi:hypothetical protein